MSHTQSSDVAIIGGGLAGLAAAAYLAHAGKSVILFEKARELGGRATTHIKGGFRFNLGPHALYRGGRGAKILKELGVSFSGGIPSASNSYAIFQGKKHTLPGGFVSLLTTSLFGLSAKFELAQLLGSIPKIDAHKIQQIQHLTVAQWLEQTIRHPPVRALVQTLFRLATYGNDPHHQSAGAALAQLQLAVVDNVWYLDCGWQTLVDGLHDAAQSAGVQIVSEAKIAGIDCENVVHGVCLADGSRHAATSVVIAAGPHDAANLLPPDKSACLHQWAAQAKPVHAACLDVGLSSLPRPKASFALGIDQPLYFSVHSALATLGPEDGAMIHVAKYLNPSEKTDPHQDEHELEGLLDLMQPGWRKAVLERRFLPHMMVTNAQVTAASGGTAGRPGPAVPDIARLYVAGDWVGPEGMLADASLASAKHAAELIVQDTYSQAEAA